MDIQMKEGDGFSTFRIAGRLDAVSATEGESAINDAIEAGAARLILDLTDLEYISSAGLRVLLATAKKTSRQNGKVVLCGLQKDVREVLEISGLLSIFTIAENETDAAALARE